MNFIQIVDRFRNSEQLSHEELDMLLAWLLTDEGKSQFQEELERRWSTFETNQPFAYTDLLAKVHRQLDGVQQGQPVRKTMPKYVRYSLEVAAAVLLAFGVSFLVQNKVNLSDYIGQKSNQEQVEVYNPRGLRTTVTLPDSSRVTLNADSKITYAYRLQGTTRAIKLEGEAFFEVAKDSLRPFVVEANSAKITVLGTTFNIRSYPEERSIETTLIEGSLVVSSGSQKNRLVPGQQVRIDKASQESSVSVVNTQNTIGWREGKLYFQSAPFNELATVLERTFNVNIRIDSHPLQQKKFTGKFENGENLEQILRVLKLSVGFTELYDKETNTIIIR